MQRGTTRTAVYEQYTKQWENIGEGIIETLKESRKLTNSERKKNNKLAQLTLPQKPITLDAFLKTWRTSVKWIKILKSGSDFCDTCTFYKNSFAHVDDVTKQELKKRYLAHRNEAAGEFKFYKSIMECSEKEPEGEAVHLIFDFAEKVLIPRLQDQPGQLHFTTSLKIDIFGIYCSNLKEMFVYGLTEGHWPSHKTANEVGSMLHYQIDLLQSLRTTSTKIKEIVFHADNCGGQNKNRYILWYLAWRVIACWNLKISLCFLVAGHTKNRADAGFGLVKRKLKQNDVIVPAEMMKTIETSSVNNTCVCGSDVNWFNWKYILERYFTIPRDFKITQYHIFNFDQSRPGVVYAKELTTSDGCEFNLLKKDVDVIKMQEEIKNLMQSTDGFVPIIPLTEVPSAHEGNRHAYLMKNVINRYYSSNMRVLREYFENGTAYRHEQFKWPDQSNN